MGSSSGRGHGAVLAVPLVLVGLGAWLWWGGWLGPSGAPESARGEERLGSSGEVAAEPVTAGALAPAADVSAPPSRAEVGEPEARVLPAALSLRVVDALSGQPLGGAVVRASESDPAEVWTADESGRLDLPFAEGPLVASHGGYLEVRFEAQALVAEARSAPSAVARVELPPLGELLVRVVGSAGEPVEGAHLQIFVDSKHPKGRRWSESLPLFVPPGTLARLAEGAEWWRSLGLEPTPLHPRLKEAATDERGEYVIASVPRGTPLHVLVGGPVTRTSGRATIPPETHRGELEIAVDRGFVVRGRLTMGGKPGGTTVELEPTGGSPLSGSAGPDGIFVLEGVPGGWARLQPLWFEAEATDVFVDADIDLGDIEVGPFLLGGRSAGRLVSRDPFQPNSVFVRFVRSATAGQSSVPVAADGSFAVEGRPGSGWLVVSTSTAPAPNRVALTLDVELPLTGLEVDVDRYLAAVEVELAPDEESPQGTFAQLFLVAAAANPSPARTLAPAGRAHRIAFDGEGPARLAHVAPGVFDISLVVSDGRVLSWPRTELEAGGTVRLSAADALRAELTGRVVGLAGNDAAGATVRLSPPLGRRATLPLDPAGDFRFAGLFPGPHTIEVQAADGRVLALESVPIEPGEQHLELVLRPSASLSGRWMLPAFAGSSASVSLRSMGLPHGVAPHRQVAVDGDGHFRFEDLPAGKYSLVGAAGRAANLFQLREEIDLKPGEHREVLLEAPVGYGTLELQLPEKLGWVPGPAELLAPAGSGLVTARIDCLGDGRYRAPASEGPAVLLVAALPSGFLHHPVYGGIQRHLVALLPAGIPAGATLTTGMDGPSLEIDFESDRPEALLPIVRAIEVGGLPLDEPSRPWTLAALEQSPRWVRFAPLPPGTRVVVIDPLAPDAQRTETHQLTGPLRLRRP